MQDKIGQGRLNISSSSPVLKKMKALRFTESVLLESSEPKPHKDFSSNMKSLVSMIDACLSNQEVPEDSRKKSISQP